MGSASGGFWAKLLPGGVGGSAGYRARSWSAIFEVRTDERRDLYQRTIALIRAFSHFGSFQVGTETGAAMCVIQTYYGEVA
jgi:hypothetical protein